MNNTPECNVGNVGKGSIFVGNDCGAGKNHVPGILSPDNRVPYGGLDPSAPLEDRWRDYHVRFWGFETACRIAEFAVKKIPKELPKNNDRLLLVDLSLLELMVVYDFNRLYVIRKDESLYCSLGIKFENCDKAVAFLKSDDGVAVLSFLIALRFSIDTVAGRMFTGDFNDTWIDSVEYFLSKDYARSITRRVNGLSFAERAKASLSGRYISSATVDLDFDWSEDASGEALEYRTTNSGDENPIRVALTFAFEGRQIASGEFYHYEIASDREKPRIVMPIGAFNVSDDLRKKALALGLLVEKSGNISFSPTEFSTIVVMGLYMDGLYTYGN